MNENFSIKVFGIQQLDFQEVECFDFDRNETYFSQKVTFDFEERETDLIITVSFTDFGFITEEKMRVWSTTKTGFQLWGDDISFMLNATNPECVKYCCELYQIASANNRLYLMESTMEKSYPVLLTPYIKSNDLPSIVKLSLFTGLN